MQKEREKRGMFCILFKIFSTKRSRRLFEIDEKLHILGHF
jgi:hypothetical protein